MRVAFTKAFEKDISKIESYKVAQQVIDIIEQLKVSESLSEIQNIKLVCQANNMALHLDGARIFNALVETGESPMEYGKAFDSMSVCLSKGLGTPIGSVLLGTKDFIKKARRVRKRFGGGWRSFCLR